MGFIRFDSQLDNLMTPEHSKARGPVVRGQQTELARVRIRKGEGAEVHSHPEEQWVYVLEGRLRVTLGETTYDVGVGEGSFHPSGVSHGSEALEDCQLLSFKSLVAPKYSATSEAS
jgi:quercetin dioxygenase-like cupin family protein